MLISCVSFTHAKEIEVHFSPSKKTEVRLVQLIESANKTLDVAAYSLTLESFAAALIRAKNRGVKVRVFMDKVQVAGRSSLDEHLLANDIPVKIDPWSGLMHNKYLIVDKCTIETGSFNFTANAVKNNRENFLIFTDCKKAKEFQANFEQMWAAV